MPKLSFIDSLLRRGRHSVQSDVLKAGPVLNIREGEEIIVLYTSAADKMKFFSAIIREGLENGDMVTYNYPDEESETVRAKLMENGIDVKKYEKNGSLELMSLSEFFLSDGKLDYNKAVVEGINWWNEVKMKGYKHARSIEDFGDFSFADGQWQRYVTDYWLDPRWDDPNTSEWIESTELVGIIYNPLIMDITAINIEHMTEIQVNEFLKALSGNEKVPEHTFIDLIEFMDSFSRSIGLNHKQLIGRKILLEFNPSSHYEKVVDSLAKESRANVEPLFVFTPSTSPIHNYLAKQPAIKFFLTSLSTSTPKSISENKVLLPAKNMPLILDAVNKVLEIYANTNICFVFDILSELLTTIGQERTFTFMRHALDLLSSEKTTSIFLLNPSAHRTDVVSRIRGLFHNLLAYDKDEIRAVKIS